MTHSRPAKHTVIMMAKAELLMFVYLYGLVGLKASFMSLTIHLISLES